MVHVCTSMLVQYQDNHNSNAVEIVDSANLVAYTSLNYNN